MDDLLLEVKKKKEFSKLPDSIVERALTICKNDVKETRAFLRKYFGVFLTNRVLKSKGNEKENLGAHISSKKRNYESFYSKIFESLDFEAFSVVDLGCGSNGFSYKYLKENFDVKNYIGLEASGQIVENLNSYFEENNFSGAKVIWADLFDIEKVLKILKNVERPRVVFLFQVVDALENFEKDFSKKFISEVSTNCEAMVVSWPLVSISGKKSFEMKRKWLTDFLESRFEILNDFEENRERVLVFRLEKD